jgi:ABC-2 type transport system ATP-binding protein
LNESPPIVELENVHKRYGDFAAVGGVSLAVARGEIFALLGPNGAGKTTTIRMLMGILQPSEGALRIDGLDCFRDRVEVKRRVGYLPDDPIFYDYLKGREIIQFVGEMHGMHPADIRRAADALVDRFGLGDDLEEFATNYSRGMKKKLGIVCCLLHDPPLVILDEPTNGLDPYATRIMHELVRETAEAGKSIFFSTHLLAQAEKLSPRVGILYRGELAAVGHLDELRANLEKDASLEEIFFSVTGEGEEAPPEAPAAE